MRIALITSLLWGGGAARVLVNMANYWSRAGHDVILFSFEDGKQPPFYSVDDNVKLVYLDIFGISRSVLASIKNNIHRCLRIRKALLATNPDVVISFIDTANIRVILAMLGAGVPIIVSERIHPAHEPIGKFWKLLRRISYPFSKALIVQTSAVQQFFKSWGLRDVRVIPNPVRPPRISGDAPRLKKPCVVAVGRMAKQKNYPLLLRAFDKVRHKHPAWQLFIAGKRAPDHAVEMLMDTHSLHDSVNFIGQVADIDGVLEQADIYVLSSTYEGFPNALCEAMASGLACIATDCPSGPADIITHDKNGLLVPNGDEKALAAALRQLMDDTDKRHEIGKTARKIIQYFDETAIMNRWDACIADLLKREM